MIYLGHDLIKYDEPNHSFDRYLCKKCGYDVWYHKTDKFWDMSDNKNIFENKNVFEIMTCDESIIKNILE